MKKVLIGLVAELPIAAPAAQAMGPVAKNVWQQIAPRADVRYVNETAVRTVGGSGVLDTSADSGIPRRRGDIRGRDGSSTTEPAYCEHNRRSGAFDWSSSVPVLLAVVSSGEAGMGGAERRSSTAGVVSASQRAKGRRQGAVTARVPEANRRLMR